MELPTREIQIDTVVNNIFLLMNNIAGLLQDTLQELSSIPSENRMDLPSDLELRFLRETRSLREKEEDIGFRGFQSGIASQPKCSMESSPKQEDIVVGLDDDIIKITDELTRPPSRLKIVSIVGMVGIGKTTLARKVCQKIASYFHCFTWIDRVSKVDPVRELLSSLLDSFALSTDEIQGKTIEDLGLKLNKSLRGKKYLIVIDDLWNLEAWAIVWKYFPDDNKGSRIIITSRFTEFPNHVNHEDPPHYMRLPDERGSWELLKKLVYGEKSCHAELEYFGMQIAKKCWGLPLALVIIGGTLSRIQSTPEHWEDVMYSVNSIVCTDPLQCLDILSVSYSLLPHHLKTCFFYVAAFPAYAEIQVWKLISLWIAEGFLDLKSSTNVEEMAEHYLEDLIGRSLVLVGKRSFGGKIKTCLIHDLLRELCLREAHKENFVCVLETHAQVFPAGIDKQRRLIFNLDDCANLQLLPSIPHLRSFMWFTLGSDFIPGTFGVQLLGFKLLTVLDMFFLCFDAFPVLLLNLVNLRYLALNVTYELEASMSELWKLQSFIVYGPWTPKDNEESPTLSLEYWSMPWLRHLQISVPSHLRYPSIGNRDLHQPLSPKYLQTLSTITFSSCSKEVFSIMPYLKKLGISETKEEYNTDGSSECLKNLCYLRELEILKCSFYRGNREARSLCIYSLPSSLKKLSLSGGNMSWEKMIFVAKLTQLETLKLKICAFQGPKWEQTTEVFHCLKQLLIDNTDLVNWETTSTDHFPSLEQLILKSCRSLAEIPSDVLFCIQKRIKLHYCSVSAETSSRAFQANYESLEVVIRGDCDRPSSSA